MQRELEWMGTSPSARRSKSKARIAAYNQMVEEDKQETLDKAQIDQMNSGKTYVNVHTAKNPNGEIRGQIVAIG